MGAVIGILQLVVYSAFIRNKEGAMKSNSVLAGRVGIGTSGYAVLCRVSLSDQRWYLLNIQGICLCFCMFIHTDYVHVGILLLRFVSTCQSDWLERPL